jgi:tRNA dimethylallyltransferase
LRGETTLEEAGRRAVLATGQYAKRQATWLRHHPMTGNHGGFSIIIKQRFDEQFLESISPGIRDIICRPVDAAQHDVYE